MIHSIKTKVTSFLGLGDSHSDPAPDSSDCHTPSLDRKRKAPTLAFDASPGYAAQSSNSMNVDTGVATRRNFGANPPFKPQRPRQPPAPETETVSISSRTASGYSDQETQISVSDDEARGAKRIRLSPRQISPPPPSTRGRNPITEARKSHSAILGAEARNEAHLMGDATYAELVPDVSAHPNRRDSQREPEEVDIAEPQVRQAMPRKKPQSVSRATICLTMRSTNEGSSAAIGQ
jgi:hypothetical protein